MANKANLIPIQDRTTNEQRKIAQKGGIASGKARRKKRSIKEAAQLIMGLPVVEKYQTILEEIDAPQNSYTNAALLVAKMFELAISGDTRAARLLYDFTEENPAHEINRKRLALLEAELNKPNAVEMWVDAVLKIDSEKEKEGGD